MVKGKRWKKGQSSSSNPSTHKHREMAKNNRNFFNFGQPSQNTTSHLTSQALAQLNASNNENSLDMKSLISDSESIGRDSFASHWSDCTNATFNRVHKYWRSNSAMHKEILAVLAAVTEVIKENSGEGTEVEYFAALMTGLEPVKDNEETAAAFLYLISLAIRKVPESVLKVKFDELLKVFMDILEKHGGNANNYVLIKSCLICLCCLLKCQERKAWQSNEAVAAYKKILSFVNDSKPKIRKFSHQAISLILNGCSQKTTNDVYIQVSGLTADYCVKLMMGQSSSSDGDEGKETDYLKGILHMLSLLKHIARHFEGEHLKMICENLLRLITLKDLIVTESCFHVFYQLFNSKTNQLTANFNAKLINALYDYQPSEQSGPQMIVWLAVMDSAIRSLNRLNKQLCLSHLPHLVQRYMQAFCSSHAKVHFAAAKCLNAALEQCIRADIDVLVDDLNSSSEMSKSTLHKIFTHLETGLSYQYHNAWPHIIKIIGTAFTCFGHPSTFVVVAKCLHSLANLRESEQFDYIKEADSAISRAIKTYGPKLVIDCIRLDITGDESSYEYPRSWMLPLLKENIKRTELSYFVKELMPLAKKLRAKAEFFGSQGQPIQAKIFENLQNQFWSLLPGFCNFPTDFADSFGHLAKTLGETLEKCTDLRCHVLKALRTLILSNTDENKAIVSKYAKNYLPIMFNLYTTDAKQDDSIGQAILDTTKLFLKITPLDLVNTYLQQAMKNYAVYSQKHTEWLKTSKQDEIQEPPSAPKRVVFDFKKTDRDPPAKTGTEELQPFLFAKLRFLDLIAVLAKFSNRANINSVYQLAIEGITSKQSDKTVQKKSYKILDSILESGQPALNEAKNEAIFAYIVEEKFESIAKSLVGSLNDCASAAKVPRVKCLNALMAYVTDAKQKPLIRQILPEVILSVREVNQKSRDSSLALLNSMLRLWQKLGAEATPPLNEADSLDEFVRLVMVSLAGSINMVSCGCLALSSLSYEFKENLSGSIIKDLVEASCHLVRKSEHKEVIVSGLNLLKVLCSIFQSTTLGQYLDCICDTIHSLHEKRLSSSPAAASATSTATATAETSAVTAPPVTKSQRIKQFVKLILKKLMKKFTSELITQKLFANEAPTGANSMETAVPGATKPALTAAMRHGLENLIANLKKAIDKERARKTEEQLDAKKNKGAALDVISLYTAAAPDNEDASKSVVLNEIGDLLKESDSESEAEDAKSRKTTKSSREEKREKRREGKAKSSGKAWLQDNDEDNPLDLLDPMAIKSVLASRPKSKQDQEKKTKNGGFKMNASGKLVIEDDESSDSSDDDMKSKTSRKSKAKGKKNDDDLEEMMDTLSITKKSAHSAKQKKRKMDDDSDEDNDDTKSKFTYRSGGTGIHRKLNTDTNSKKKNVEYGSEYKPKKAAGDMKVKNKPDPYAYIPFNPLKLNKRKRAKFSGEFKGVVKAGKPNNKQNEKTKRNN